METIRKDASPAVEILPGVLKKPRIRTEAVEILELELAPGSALLPHDMPSLVCFYVIEGVGTFTFADEAVTVPAGDMVRAETGRLRFWSNRGGDVLRLLVIKSLDEK